MQGEGTGHRGTQARRWLGALAEVATSAVDRASFREEALRWIDGAIGLDRASFGTATNEMELTTRDIPAKVGTLYYEAPERFEGDLRALMGTIAERRDLLDTYEAVPVRARSRQPLFGEIFDALGTRSMASALLRKDGAVSAILHFYRTSRGARLRAHEAELLRRALPILAMGDALHGGALRVAETPGLGRDLTARERVVLRHLVAGLSNRQVADTTGRSVNTVRNQVAALYRKLGASTRSECVAIALREGWARP